MDASTPLIERALRAANLSPAMIEEALHLATPFYYELEWSSVATGNTSSQNVTIDGGRVFIVDQVNFGAYLNAAVSSSVAGTPLVRHATENSLGDHTAPPLSKVTLQYASKDRTLMPDPIRADLITGDGQNPYWLPTKLVLPNNDVFKVTLANACGQTIDAQLALIGTEINLSPRS